VDELTAFCALLADELMGEDKFTPHVEQLRHIESQLMTVSALLAVSEDGEGKVAMLKPAAIEELEQAIDSMQAELPTITKFTIPGGDRRISMCHVCRTVCRRAERRVLTLASRVAIPAEVTSYLNRLSDYLFVLARLLNAEQGTEEIFWQNPC
jgi:cob(I)alamin adenosyltransferase